MAYTNNNGQTRLGWRVTTQPVVTPYLTTLLDLYSGAAAAYSLRKLKSSYTGSAIRVRRSSDNTEMNIGFDAVGNLDTIALSSFVGSGSGFVTTWYDQTGNNFNRTQTTAAAQPNIVYLGAINMVNGKPAMYFDGTGTTFALQGPKIGETYQGAGYSSTVLNVIKLDSSYSTTEEYPLFGGAGWYDSRFSINSNKWYLINTGTGISSTVNASVNQVVSSVVFAYTTDKVRINGTEVISGNVGTNGGTDYNFIGQSWLGKRYKGYFQEHIIYASDKTSVISAMESNMNTYYSAYPNPTSVWNLLTSVYSADTIASSSLKTSLVASYNGESNANDSFGTNNGTAQGGLTYGTGKIGNAFNFNGTNAYVALPVNSFKPTNTDFSISAWVNFSGTSANVQTIFSSISAIGGSKSYGIIIYYYNNIVVCQISNASVDDFTSYNTTSLFNSWNLITFTRKAGSSSKLYINGSLVSSNSLTNNPTYPNNTVPSIGAADYNGTTTNQYFCANGTKIDALNIWQKELTASEVSELYNSGNGAQYIGDNFYKPTTNDALGTNNGTAQGGLTYTTGKSGNAFNFNGTNAFIRLPNNAFNSLIGDFSVSGWIYVPMSYSGTDSIYVIQNMGCDSWFNNPYGWGFRTYGNTLYFHIFNHTNTYYSLSASYIFTNNVYTGNAWYHVAATRKGSTGSKLYINGSLVASDSNTVNPLFYANDITPTIGNLYMGTNGSKQNSYFAPNGSKVDEVNIWNKELTATEVTELYNSGNGKQYPN